MISDLDRLAQDLEHAAGRGAHAAGAGAVQAGALQAETGMRLPGMANGITVAGLGGMEARIGIPQRAGVYQEASPATGVEVDTDAITDTMASTAAQLGARAVTQ